MAKKEGKHSETPKTSTASILPRNIVEEMQEAYLDYAMSVITARALPDVRDGLKPVHRRILYTMQKMGLTSSAKFRKSAKIVGEVMGSYHPHGDAAIYDSMVNMAQDFSYRYPLIIGQGNFGSIDGDPPAAMRYSEAKMAKLSAELLRDLEKDTVAWIPNYDGTVKEPTVLPTVAPNLLLNGTFGIAVGMASNIPPHNLAEVVDAAVHLVEHEDATTEDLLTHIKGPDFPLGGIIFNKKDIHHAYANGKGGVVCRGEAEIVETKKGQSQIVISSIPYRVNKAELIKKIADLVREKKIEGIKDLRDESTDDIRVVIELKGGAFPQKILNALYKHTQLEDTFHFNMVAIVDGVPQTLSLKTILEEFLVHRGVVVRRRSEFDLKKAKDREHILLGLTKALDHIDKIIALIKKSKDVNEARGGLMKTFKFSELQANAILEMKLQKLAGLERKKIEDELKDIQARIKELTALLKDPKKILKVIKDELVEVKDRHGDRRRTKVVAGGVKAISVEDLVPEEESVLVLTEGGYIKRTNPGEYKRQKRGGQGVIDLNTKEEDVVNTLLTTSTHSDLLFFTDRGKVYRTKMYDIPEGKRATRGKSIMNFLSLESSERVTSVLALPKEKKEQDCALVMVTKNGIAKKVNAQAFHDVRRSGLIAITLKGGDKLVAARFVSSNDSVVITTQKGQSIRFDEADIRAMGRSAAGVKALKLGSGDGVVGASVVQKDVKDPQLFIMTEKGYGKRTPLSEYKVQNRGGSGIKTANITDKTGSLIAAKVVSGDDGEVVAISQKGQVIRVGLKEIPSLGRATQGVKIMKMKAGDKIASVVCL